MKKIHTQHDVEQIKLGEVVCLNGRIVTLRRVAYNTCRRVAYNTCNNCAFNVVVRRPNGAFTKCTMPFRCRDGYSFEEIKEGGL